MEKSCTVISREIVRRTNLKYNRKYAAILSLLFIVNIIGNTACGNTSAETGHVSIADMAMENTPIINYTIPTLTPNVLVDQQGYAGDGEKQAIPTTIARTGRFTIPRFLSERLYIGGR